MDRLTGTKPPTKGEFHDADVLENVSTSAGPWMAGGIGLEVSILVNPLTCLPCRVIRTRDTQKRFCPVRTGATSDGVIIFLAATSGANLALSRFVIGGPSRHYLVSLDAKRLPKVMR
jgi:hypothetical protein